VVGATVGRAAQRWLTFKAMSQKQPDDVVRAWRESAPYWEKHRETVRLMFEPLTRALIEETGVAESINVLDVACGAGEPGLTLAQIVGPTGSVTCTDIVPEMVAAAERQAVSRKLTNMNFCPCAADALPFDDETFDVVVCRLGAMFFPEPLAALREILRVTKPQGKVAFAVWHNNELNPFFSIATHILSRYVESPPEDPRAPGAFRFAKPGVFRQILKNAGAAGVRERVFEFRIAAPLSPEEFWTMRSEMSETMREKLARLGKKRQKRARQETIDAAHKFFVQNQMSFPAKAIIVSGAKGIGNRI
jgi:ubiquinone/menaquinone biosynthesis C-methylase UbiE